MGTSFPSADPAVVSNFYRASTWIEASATKQVSELASLPGVVAVAAFPDLHPGKFGPVGVAVDVAGAVYPGLIGNDIGCGVALAATDLPAHKLSLDRAAKRLGVLDAPEPGDTLFGTPLGTLGGGNHFCELTAVKAIFDEAAAEAAGLRKGMVNLLVHTGSRGLGTAVFEGTIRDAGTGALTGETAERYLARHDEAVAFALANRRRVVERAADAIHARAELLSDVAHNFVAAEDGVFRHRKGASTTRQGLCVILGSRGALSYVVAPVASGRPSLASLAHGAGRKLDRASARAKFGGKGVIERETKNPFGGRIICNDKALAAEEAAGAYKSIEQVIADLESFGLIRVIASLQPLLTFKTAGVQP